MVTHGKAARPIVVMGVSGAGKSTVGRALAGRLGRPFIDGDDFHPASNIRKMAAGQPLDEADRAPWIARLSDELARELSEGRAAVLACSALSRTSRALLARGCPGLLLVHLEAPRSVVAARLSARSGHFMPASLLDSQYAALERPSDALTVDASEGVAVLVERIARAVGAIEARDVPMQIGMIGLGRMGGNMVRRLQRAGHTAVVHDASADAVATLVEQGASGAGSLSELVERLQAPRVICVMVPAARVDAVIDELSPLLAAGDVVIDGGNSHFHDDTRRARQLAERGLHYVDMGTSGGVRGLERGYCLMIGGEREVVERLDPLFAALAPGSEGAPPTPGRARPGSTAERGYLHCGPAGAGHFVKMVHNGIEYGLMAAYAEGLNILASAGAGLAPGGAGDAETAPLRNAEQYRYEFDLADITELWRRGSVIASWLLDLTAQALADDPRLEHFDGTVADSGEGRWTVAAANDLGVPAHVLAAALFERFASRGNDAFQNKVLSAMRLGFGGHRERS